MVLLAKKGSIDTGRSEELLKLWTEYLEQRDAMAAALQDFDYNSNGKLEKLELKEYLKHLNDGDGVSDKDLDNVFSAADVFKDGAIRQVELGLATATWQLLSARRAQPSCLPWGGKSWALRIPGWASNYVVTF